MDEAHLIWTHTPEEIAQGFAKTEDGFCCCLCGMGFEQGRIYTWEDGMYDALGAVRRHVAERHGNPADFLLEQEPGLTGLTEIQRQLLQLLSRGSSDREIAAALGVAPSTVRNHRFKLREKEKQARVFLALMAALEQKTHRGIGQSDQGTIQEIHASAAMVDDRYSITDRDREKVLKAYFDKDGALLRFPSKEKKKIILLQEIVKNFKRGVSYSEPEVNRLLKRIYAEDHVSLRRALIEYGFMDRSPDGRVYRVKE